MNLLSNLLRGAAFSALALVSMAQTPAPVVADDSGPSFTITPAYVSQYIFRGARIGGAAFTPTIEGSIGNLTVGAWGNIPLKNGLFNQSNIEFDYYGSYGVEVIKDTLTVTPGFTAYTYPHATRTEGTYRATFEPSLALAYTVADITFTPKVYYDLTLKGATYEFSTTYTVPLKALDTELDLTATAGTFEWTDVTSSGPRTKNWGNYYLVGVSAPFKVGKNSTLSLGYAYTKGTGNYLKVGNEPQQSTGVAGHGVVTVSYSLSF